MDIWVASSFWLLWIMLWSWGYKYLFKTLLSFLLGIYSKVELRDHMVILYFNEISIVFCIVATSDYIPRTSIGEFSFCTPFPAFIICRLFGDGHSDWWEMIPHCGFDLYFSNNEWFWASFNVFISHLYVFFGEMSVSFFGPFFDWVVYFSGFELQVLFVYILD